MESEFIKRAVEIKVRIRGMRRKPKKLRADWYREKIRMARIWTRSGFIACIAEPKDLQVLEDVQFRGPLQQSAKLEEAHIM